MTEGTKRSSDRPHVLILVENLSVPFDRRVWQESRALTDAGYHVSVICPQGSGRDTASRERIEGVEIHRYPLRAATGGPAGYPREYFWALLHTARLVRAIHRRRPVDVVHACNPPDILLATALPLRWRGVRMVFDHHDLVPELFKSRFGRGGVLYSLSLLAERFAFSTAHVVISTNESYRQIAIRRGGRRPEDVFVVRSAPDLSRFTPVPPEDGLRRGKRYLLCYLGVMGPQDGVDYALRAVAHMRDGLGRDDFHVALLGSGDAYDGLVALSRELRIDDIVEFTGRADDDMIRRYLSTADVCLAPDPKNPLNDLSTMNKIMEYMAMGRAFVSFDLREGRVSAGDAALYATPNDTEEFASQVCRLLDDPGLRADMGRIGRARIDAGLSWDASTEHLLAAYRHVLGHREGAPGASQDQEAPSPSA